MRMSFGYTEKWVGGKKSIQLKMEDASQMVGHGCAPKPCGWVRPEGGKRSDPDELVRFLMH